MWFARNPMALYERANELAMRGNTDRAIVYYRKAIDSGHQRAAAEAGIKLGLLYKRTFRLGQATDAFHAAIDTGHPDLAPVATYLLAGVLSNLQLHDAAADAYRKIIDSGHELAFEAAYALAELTHYDLNEPRQAAALYQRIIDADDPDIAPKALFSMAQLLLDDDPDAAADLLRRAIDSGHLRAAPHARRELRALRERRGEPVDPPFPVSLRPATGCQLVLDGDGEVEALWFEDGDVGYRHAVDPQLLREVLLANKLADLLDVGYAGGADGERGGYLITFRRGA